MLLEGEKSKWNNGRCFILKKAGPQNTSACIEKVKQELSRGFCHLVVASTSGDTGLLMAETLQGTPVNIVVVTHSAGFKEPNTQELLQEKADAIRKIGAKIHTGTILTHSLEVALTQKHGGIYPGMLIAQTLRRFGQGSKVACEIVMQACDAGLVPEGHEVIAVGGTVQGADTALVIRSASSKRFLELKVLEILAKPRD